MMAVKKEFEVTIALNYPPYTNNFHSLPEMNVSLIQASYISGAEIKMFLSVRVAEVLSLEKRVFSATHDNTLSN